MPVTPEQAAIRGAIGRASRYSPFLRTSLERHPRIASALVEGSLDEALLAAGQAGAEGSDVSAQLRRERSALALAIGIGDLAGLLGLEQVVAALSDFADRACRAALEAAFAERCAGPPEGFAIIALGKHGSRELNYSSDIDPILLYHPDRLPRQARQEAGQAAVRIGQKLVELLQRREADGYVFRVDLRLRPSPEVTPIVLPVDAAISHYESSALPWERAALIRARFVAGDQELGRYFLEAVHPFVWRRGIDFGAIDDLQAVTRRIRGHYFEGQAFGPGYDLKRGRGGIREIEFYTQMHQLIHGGRDPDLRPAATLDALAALERAGRIDGEKSATLGQAYRLLRTLEHRLQMVDDRQTHSLPTDADELANVAHLHGLVGGQELLDLIEPEAGAVAALYEELGGAREQGLPHAEGALDAELARAGFPDPVAVRQRIEVWRSGRPRSLRTPAAREAFEAMLPALTAAFGSSPDPMRALHRFDDVVNRLPSGVNFFRLLQARPGLTELLATVMAHAPALAEQLARRPELLDGLIDASAFEPRPKLDDLVAQFSRAERRGEDYQLLLDRVRRRVNEQRFALGVQLVLARSDPLDVAEGYSRVAEAAINVLAAATLREFEGQHGRVPGSELLILGLGRLGGEALTYASDLDLVYLFTGDYEAQSDGPKPLRATDYFNRLAARISAALSVSTAAGPLYDVDTRLRPSGADGLLAVSLASFAEYQRDQAWTWEHMALTRARPVFGSDPARQELRQIVTDTLALVRNPVRTTADAAAMRREMTKRKPPKGPLDIKLGEGGLVDLEFAVHTLQLRHRIGLHPRLEDALSELVEAGLLGPEIDPALRLLTRILVTLRLVSPHSLDPPAASRPLVAQACGMSDWDSLLAAHDAARQRVASLWREVASLAEG